MNKIFLSVMAYLILMSHQSVNVQSEPSIASQPELIFVKGGTFKMGSNNDNKKDEAPVHSITVSDFSIGKYPITVEQYKRFCEATGHKMPKAPKWGWNSNHPMVNVSYNDAVSYCSWLGEKYGGKWRLPTEAEWEYAARGGNKSKDYTYSGSNDLETVGWFNNNSGKQSHPVGSKKSNELNIYDMSGNVWEWCNDWYSENYYAASPRNNPIGPTFKQANISGTFGHFRVLRGGSWYLDSSYCRVTDRSYYLPKRKWYNRGFRIVFVQ